MYIDIILYLQGILNVFTRYTKCMHLIYTGGSKYANAVRTYRKNGKVKKVYTYLSKS